jgi:hypothetical protein
VRLFVDVEKGGGARQVANNMAPARGLLDKQSYTQKYVTVIAFPPLNFINSNWE